MAILYSVVADFRSEINGLIVSLDVATEFYQAHSDGNLSQTLAAAWRSTLRRQGIQEGQTTSKFSLLEFLRIQNIGEVSHDAEHYPVHADKPPEPSTLLGADMESNICPTADRHDVLDDLWASTQLDMDFDSFETRVDAFCRIFDDWSLAVE